MAQQKKYSLSTREAGREPGRPQHCHIEDGAQARLYATRTLSAVSFGHHHHLPAISTAHGDGAARRPGQVQVAAVPPVVVKPDPDPVTIHLTTTSPRLTEANMFTIPPNVEGRLQHSVGKWAHVRIYCKFTLHKLGRSYNTTRDKTRKSEIGLY